VTLSYKGHEPSARSAEGYRIVWIWSSQKAALDGDARDSRIQRAIDELLALSERVKSPRSRLRSATQILEAATTVLADTHAERWLAVKVTEEELPHFKQASAGRPGKNTPYKRLTKKRFLLHWDIRPDTVQYDTLTDGIFPLIFNDQKMPMKDVLLAYKHQPFVEKRHQQLKTVLRVRPILLKSHVRTEAFLIVFFLALLTQTLVERELRRQMKAAGIASLPLYPEVRTCKNPTADRVFQFFGHIGRQRLITRDGAVVQRFYDPLEVDPIRRTVFRGPIFAFGQLPKFRDCS